MRLDHSLEDILNLQNLSIAKVTASSVRSRDPVGNSENGTEIVGGVTPLGGQPAVIEIEPSNHSTDVESTIDRVKLVWGTRHLGAVGDNGAFDDGTEDVLALLELESLKTAAESI